MKIHLFLTSLLLFSRKLHSLLSFDKINYIFNDPISRLHSINNISALARPKKC